MFRNYICALDIGSSKVSAAVVELKKKHISKIFFESLPSRGYGNGTITDSIELVGCLGNVLEKLKEKSGINIKFVYTNISGQDITTKHSQAIIPLAERGNKVIMFSDIRKANEQARILGSSLEEEILHQMPFGYSIDSKGEILNPLGLYGHRLKVDLYLICGKLSSLQSMIRVVNQAGFEVKDLFFSGLATSEAVFSHELKKGVNVLCDIGHDLTEVMLFKEGLLRSIEILPVGGYNLTRRLAAELKIPLDLAEEVKRSYASVDDPAKIKENKEIMIKKDSIYHAIKQRAVVEIATFETKALCLGIKETIEKMTNLYEVDNVVTVGRTVLLEGLLEALETTLSVPAKLGRIVHPEIVSTINADPNVTGQKYFNYITALGIICQAMNTQPPQTSSAKQPPQNFFRRTMTRAQEIYQEYF